MRREIYTNSALVEIIQIIRMSGIAHCIRENPPGTVVEDRLATPDEVVALVAEETEIQDKASWQIMKNAISALPSANPIKEILEILAYTLERRR